MTKVGILSMPIAFRSTSAAAVKLPFASSKVTSETVSSIGDAHVIPLLRTGKSRRVPEISCILK